MLFIGSVQGGPEVDASLFGKMEKSLMALAVEERGDFSVGSSAAVNVVYHVPGSIVRTLDYEGLRTGIFSRKQKLLMVQVAVPIAVANSNDVEELAGFFVWSLHEANSIASDYFKKKGIKYSEGKFSAMVDSIENRLSAG